MPKLFSSKKKKNRKNVEIKEEIPIDENFEQENPLEDFVDEETPVEESIDAEKEDATRPPPIVKRSGRSRQYPTRKKILYGLLILAGVVSVTIALRSLLGGVIEDAAARSEYRDLRERFPDIAGERGSTFEETDELPPEEEDDDDLRNLSLDELAAINGDFIGWINANNNQIDYPVVRGRDNDRYINITFFGGRNTAGTIFMDYRNARGFDEQVTILYGHHTWDGSMFASLASHLNQNFRSNNPNVTITTRDGRKLTYRIFAAKLTDAWDEAYTVGIHDTARAADVFPNAPANATNFLLLSTCTRSRNADERILVFAALT